MPSNWGDAGVLRLVHDDRDGRGRIVRREMLRLSIHSLFGLGCLPAFAGLGDVLGLKAKAVQGSELAARSRGFGQARSVIVIYASGGQSQLDTWDPKPHAPLDIRGAFQPIQTAIPGVIFGEHMPRLAALADRFAVIRSMSHQDLDHGSATYLALTGQYHRRLSSNPDPSPLDLPTLGSRLNRISPGGNFPYPALHINAPALVPIRVAPGQDAGLLGRDYDPLLIGDPTQGGLALPGLETVEELPVMRLDERHGLKATLDAYVGRLATRQPAQDLSHLYQQALEMLSSPRCRHAFDLQREPESLRDRYGRHRSGQSCLLARRLVEAGARYVNVIWNHSNRGQDERPDDTDVYGWDTHNDIFAALADHLMPRFDASVSTLLQDLEQRGLLKETLVVCMGEFGRAPRVAREPGFKGNAPGRKHWATVYSIMLAGAGVQPGKIVGASDRLGGEPVGERFGPWDVAATIFSALGIMPSSHFTDQLERPFPLSVGQPIEALYS
jgi:hypothetical protein